MARFLFTVWSFAGHLNPNVAVATALREHGHEVAFYSGRRAASSLHSAGIPHFVMDHVDEDPVYNQLFPANDQAGRLAGLKQMGRFQTALRAWMVDTVPGQLADLEPLVDRWSPDVIVCDPTMWVPLMVLREARSIPVAVLAYTTGCMLSGRDAPVWGRGLPAPTTPARRIRNTVETWLLRAFNHQFRQEAYRLRARYGLPPFASSVTDFAGTVPLYLVTSVRELDYNRRDIPANVHYVGRCSWDRPATALPPAWIQDLSTELPIVYVTEGTVQNGQPALLQVAARGLAHLPVQVILSLNAGRAPESLGLANLAPNVRLEYYYPGQGWQNDILARAALAVTNGGAGSVLAALAAGVPQIVVPTVWDKPENAQRVAEAAVGMRLSPRGLTPQRLRAAVMHILGYESYAANARRIGAELRNAGGPRKAAYLLNGLVTRSATLPLEQAGSQQLAVP